MNSDTTLARNEAHSVGEMDKPVASYIKTILGQVAVQVWDNILQRPVDVILKGDPKKKDEDSIVRVWSLTEDKFFRRINRTHFAKGIIIPYAEQEYKEPEKTIEQATDEELQQIINSKFIAFTNKLSKINSIPVLFRMKVLAEEMDKSAKILGAIEARISELQTSEYITPAETE